MAKKRTIAALDVGSHEITLKIAQLEREGLPIPLETVSRTLAIGTDTYKSGEISPSTSAEIVAVLDQMLLKLKEYKTGQILAAATSAVREAKNRELVLDQIDRACHIPIEVLSNAEERYNHMLALSALWLPFAKLIEQGTLVLDIGSGSVQVTVYDKSEYVFSQNMQLGALRIREVLSDLERRTTDFGRLMEAYISTDLENYRMLEPKGTSYKHLIVLGSGSRFLKKLAHLDPTGHDHLKEQDFDQIYRQLLVTRPADLAMAHDIPVEHASLLLPTAIMIRKFLSFTGARQVELPSIALVDGLLVEIAQRHHPLELTHHPERDILFAARQMVRRYQSDKKHVGYVEKVACLIFDETRRLHRLKARERLLLQLASLLHDVGKFVNMSHHYLRSFNIILSTEIIGLTPLELHQVAWIARLYGDQSVLDDPDLNELPAPARLVVLKLAAILRLADALDANHNQAVSLAGVKLDDSHLVLLVESGEDLTLVQWSLELKRQLFLSMYGLLPKLRIRSR